MLEMQFDIKSFIVISFFFTCFHFNIEIYSFRDMTVKYLLLLGYTYFIKNIVFISLSIYIINYTYCTKELIHYIIIHYDGVVSPECLT